MADHQRHEVGLRAFDNRLRIINTQIKPGFAALRAEAGLEPVPHDRLVAPSPAERRCRPFTGRREVQQLGQLRPQRPSAPAAPARAAS